MLSFYYMFTVYKSIQPHENILKNIFHFSKVFLFTTKLKNIKLQKYNMLRKKNYFIYKYFDRYQTLFSTATIMSFMFIFQKKNKTSKKYICMCTHRNILFYNTTEI